MPTIATERAPRDILKSLVIERDIPIAEGIIADAIEYSFAHCPVREIKREEVKRRLQIAFKIFIELRAEMRYTLDRIENSLGTYLVFDIEGQKWEPLKRRTWVPGDPVSMRLPKLPDLAPNLALEHALRLAGVRVVQN